MWTAAASVWLISVSVDFVMTSIEKFQLGYCTESHDAMSQEALRKGYKKEFLVKTGICYETDDHVFVTASGDV